MSGDFDPSPRASKRQKVAEHSVAPQIAGEENTGPPDTISQDKPTPTRRSRGSKNRQGEAVDISGSHFQKNSSLGNGDAEVTKTGSSTQERGSSSTRQRSSRIPANSSPSIASISVENYDEAARISQPRSSGRERRRPRRYSISPETSRTATPIVLAQPAAEEKDHTSPVKQSVATPKGILTPSKGRRVQPRKSVVFDERNDTVEQQLGFKDIDPSNNGVKKGPARSAPGTPLHERKSKDTLVSVSTTKSKPKGISSVAQNGQTRETDEGEDDDVVEQIIQNLDRNSVDTSRSIKPAEHDVVTTSDPYLLDIKARIVSRLVGCAPPFDRRIPAHLKVQHTSLHDLLTATITTGESNSILLLGSRGAGKTYLLDTTIDEMTRKHGNEFHVVRLSGFFQTDDKVALREIWRQLGREMEVDEMETEAVSSYADTMASLLSLLSHPDELLPTTTSDAPGIVDPARTTRTSKSIVFVLDEFDLFTTHPRQTLLYNLFDIAQSRKAPIAVVGCSTRMDVVECLEKRVKSRFSHRWLHVPTFKSLDGFEAVVRDVLTIEPDADQDTAKRSTQTSLNARKQWNRYMEEIFLPSTPVRDLLQRVFYTTKSIPELLTALYQPVVALDVSETCSSDQPKCVTYVSNTQSLLLELLPALPTLHASLLIAAARLDTIYNLAAFNFNVVFDHYSELVKRSKLQQTASGAVAVGAGLRQWRVESAQRAWEDLGIWQLIIPISGRSTGNSALSGLGATVDTVGGEGASTRMWRVDITLEDLDWALKERSAVHGLHDENRSSVTAGTVLVLSKWCREI